MNQVFIILIFILFSFAETASAEQLKVTGATKETLLKGYTRSIKSQKVSSEVSGKVSSVNYEIGDRIGTLPFIQIDSTFIDYQIAAKKESLSLTEILIAKAVSRIEYQKKEAARIASLFKDEMATESLRDEIIQSVEQSQLDLNASKKEKSSLLIALEELKERKARHIIYAPEGWIVTARSVEVNEVVSPGVALAKVSDYRNLIVPLSVSSGELEAIQSLPDLFEGDLENSTVKASIHWINPEFNEQSRKLNIEIVINFYSHYKRGGLHFTLPVQVRTSGIFIPRAAVSMRYENPTVVIEESKMPVQLLVLGEHKGNFLVAEDNRLPPGTILLPASLHGTGADK